jgi:hypothetical protein
MSASDDWFLSSKKGESDRRYEGVNSDRAYASRDVLNGD